MSEQPITTTILHIEGGHAAAGPLYIAPGTNLAELADRLGVSLRFERRREPFTQADLDRADLEATIAELRAEFPVGDYPAPSHDPDDPCTYCEALRFLA